MAATTAAESPLAGAGDEEHSDSDAPATPEQHFRFMDLPPEVRIVVYRLTLVSRTRITLVSRPSDRRGLLRVSQQTRCEASSIYFRENSFRFHIVNMHGAGVVAFRTQLAPYRGLRCRRQDQQHYKTLMGTSVSWINLLAWVKASHGSPELLGTWRLTTRAYRPQGGTVAAAAFAIMMELHRDPWDKVEKTLKIFHRGIAAADPRWA
ncbi:hypothetical protein LTR53_016490 [Teratosphaeriaceae sp. CCFEE 6253]|nr:hypothetical protein LTR53_016490 [Teratosphaeriaceae sp. CCFEE 6253]